MLNWFGLTNKYFYTDKKKSLKTVQMHLHYYVTFFFFFKKNALYTPKKLRWANRFQIFSVYWWNIWWDIVILFYKINNFYNLLLDILIKCILFLKLLDTCNTFLKLSFFLICNTYQSSLYYTIKYDLSFLNNH